MIARNLLKLNSKNFKLGSFYKYNFSSQIDTVEGHRPPVLEASVHGQYAGVLFSIASKNNSLYDVQEDMKFFAEIAENEKFRSFASNQTLRADQQYEVLNSLGEYSAQTQEFLKTLCENKRLPYLGKIANKYVDFYKILNKEENIVITSHQELTSEQKDQVESALRESKGSNFTLTYQVDPSIQGGLTMTSGMEFLDCSLATRVQRLRSELSKLSI